MEFLKARAAKTLIPCVAPDEDFVRVLAAAVAGVIQPFWSLTAPHI